ncbi:hypothetical protein ACFSUK_11175 [Sphingobium scionense]
MRSGAGAAWTAALRWRSAVTSSDSIAALTAARWPGADQLSSRIRSATSRSTGGSWVALISIASGRSNRPVSSAP